MSYQVIQTPGHKEPSEISVVSDEEVVVRLSGPMSFFAAGAFILANRAKADDCVYVAMQLFEKPTGG